MAHFAQLDENNKVINVVKVIDEVLLDENGNEDEQKGVDFLNASQGKVSKWVKTSYNNNIRNKYAVIGGFYNEEYDVFLDPKPFGCESWILDTVVFDWVPPILKPENPDEKHEYVWNESIVDWELKRIPDPKPTESPDEGYYWASFDGYEWTQVEIPSQPEVPLQDGYEWIFEETYGFWIQVEIPQDPIILQDAQDAQDSQVGISTI
jgi:hypothetical protein